MPDSFHSTSTSPERRCHDCGKDLGQGELYWWGEIPLCFDCKKPRIISTKGEEREWLLGCFAIIKTSISRSIFGRGGRIPYAFLATNKRLVVFDPNAKRNREVIQEKIRRDPNLLQEVERVRRYKDLAVGLGIPLYGVLGAFLLRSLSDDFNERYLSLASVLVSLGSGRQLSSDEVAVLRSLDKTYDITRQRPPLSFSRPRMLEAFSPGWRRMEDKAGDQYLIGFNAHDFCLFYFEHFCPSASS